MTTTLENIVYYDLNEITCVVRFHANDSIKFWTKDNNCVASIKRDARGNGEHQIMRRTSEGWAYAKTDEITILRDKYNSLCQNKLP